MILRGQYTVEDFVEASRVPGFANKQSLMQFVRKVFGSSRKNDPTVFAFRLILPGALLSLFASAYLVIRVSPLWLFVAFIFARWVSILISSFRPTAPKAVKVAARMRQLDPCVIQIDATGFRRETDQSTESLAWKSVAEMQETKDLFMIIDDQRYIFLVPKRFCANPNEEAEFRDLVRNSIAQAKESA